MIPRIGKTVIYRLTASDVAQIALKRSQRVAVDSALATAPGTPVSIRSGNVPAEGDVYPMIITRAWGETYSSCVNGQVLLDGDDTLWVTSRSQVTVLAEPAYAQTVPVDSKGAPTTCGFWWDPEKPGSEAWAKQTLKARHAGQQAEKLAQENAELKAQIAASS
jgi:hypothetical protein